MAQPGLDNNGQSTPLSQEDEELEPNDRYITCLEGSWNPIADLRGYTTRMQGTLMYIARSYETNMPQAMELSPMDAFVQRQTITFDFGSGSLLSPGVTLVEILQINIAKAWGLADDPDPPSRITAQRIGTAPPPYGSNRENCAVLIQLSDCPGPLSYIIQVVARTTTGDHPTLDVILPVRVPFNFEAAAAARAKLKEKV